MRQPRYLIGALILVAALPAGSFGQTQAKTCSRMEFLRPPRWITAGAWTPDDRSLLLVDSQYYGTSASSISRYAATAGDSKYLLARSFGKSSLRAYDIRPYGDSLVVQSKDETLVTLNDQLNRSAVRNSNFKAENLGSDVLGMFQWEIVGNDVVSFSQVRVSSRRSEVAFVRFPLKGGNTAKVLHSIGLLGTDAQTFYQLNFPYIAGINDTAYFVRFDTISPEIAAYGKQSDGPVTLKPKISAPVHLARYYYPTDFEAVMKSVEDSAMPAGLYAWDNWLYLLSRRPGRDGETTVWTLRKINPRNGQDRFSWTLPTTANHLVVVPGKRQWAFVEKGPVRVLREAGEQIVQENKGVLLIDAKHFRNETAITGCR